MLQAQYRQELRSQPMIDNPLKDHETYRFVRFLGNGSFGFVVEAQNKNTDESVAIKFLPLGRELDLLRLRREILNHRRLNHHHVIGFLEVILTPTAVGIVMEYAEGGDLKNYVHTREGIGRDLARFFFQQMVVAVEYCHIMDVVNRDIKLQNTLVTGNAEWPMLKICDFGYSKHNFADSLPDSRVGTRATMAPEVVNLPSGAKYDGVKADIWCLGLFLYVLSVDQNPFYAEGERITDFELVRRIVFVEYTIPAWVAEDCADLIRRILVGDPSRRPTIPEIKQHPYFLKNLPEGALHMNQFVSKKSATQSIEETEAILDMAAGTRTCN